MCDWKHNQSSHRYKIQKPTQVEVIEYLTQWPRFVHGDKLGRDKDHGFNQVNQPEVLGVAAEAKEDEEGVQHPERETGFVKSFLHPL